jgi:2-polyprenyl-3-methyl-5-hydroxy-6-metoxy-1,4-benzoquinol methylase
MNRRDRWEQYFRLEHRLIPHLKYSQTIYEEVVRAHLPEGARWLEAGCGHQVLPDWRDQQERELMRRAKTVIGIDLALDNMKRHRTIKLLARSNLEALPFASESFDLVTCNMVVEHLADPASVFREFHRVLKPGGKVIIHTPNAFGYTTIIARMLPQRVKVKLAGLLEGRAAEDVFPALYLANTPGRLHALLTEAGFRRVALRRIATSCAFYFSRALACLELLYVRLTMLSALKNLRTNLLCIYSK